MRGRVGTLAPYSNPEPCYAQGPEGFLGGFVIANIYREYVRSWSTQPHVVDDPVHAGCSNRTIRRYTSGTDGAGTSRICTLSVRPFSSIQASGTVFSSG